MERKDESAESDIGLQDVWKEVDLYVRITSLIKIWISISKVTRTNQSFSFPLIKNVAPRWSSQPAEIPVKPLYKSWEQGWILIKENS